jgi:hypothetical protein
VAAAIVVVLIVLLVAVVPALKLGSSNGGGAETYSVARPQADGAMSGFPGGGWSALVAIGIDSAFSESVPVSKASGGSNCAVQLSPGAGANETVPAFTGNRTSGAAPAWELLYRNSSGAIAIVAVIDGSATVLGTVSGPLCSGVFGLFLPIPAGVIDSSQVGQAVAADAQPFLSSHANVTADYGLLGGTSFLGFTSNARWSVVYSTCAVGPSASGTGSEFNATVDATTGQVISDQTTASVTCTGSLSLAAPVDSFQPMNL